MENNLTPSSSAGKLGIPESPMQELQGRHMSAVDHLEMLISELEVRLIPVSLLNDLVSKDKNELPPMSPHENFLYNAIVREHILANRVESMIQSLRI